jgi:hypothetical protein
MERLDEEVHPAHEEDFDEHMNMTRAHTYRTKDKNTFVHQYAKRPGKTEDSQNTFRGIMAYHGYKQKSAKDRSAIDYEGEDEHKKHHFSAHLNDKGDVESVHHKETFKGIHEMAKIKTFGKTLRTIVPKKRQLSTKDTSLDSATAPSEKGENNKLLGLKQIIRYDSHNSNPEHFATDKSPGKKGYGPGVGYKEPMHDIKEEEELDEGSYTNHDEGSEAESVHKKLHGHWLHNKTKWTPHLMKGPKGTKHCVVTHSDGSESIVSNHQHADRLIGNTHNEEYELGKKHLKSSPDAIKHDRDRLLPPANEGLDEGLRLLQNYTNTKGHRASVHRDSDFDEYRVKFHDEHGKHMPKADYHTDDKEDAHDTAKAHLRRMQNESLDEVSKEKLGRYINKAADDKSDSRKDAALITHRVFNDGDAEKDRLYKRSSKRSQGIKSAVRKLTGRARVSAKDE